MQSKKNKNAYYKIANENVSIELQGKRFANA